MGKEGRVLTDDEAIKRYRETGEHLGKFRSPAEADKYAESLHEGQASEYASGRPDYIRMFGPDGTPADVPAENVPHAYMNRGMGFAAGTKVPMVAANGQVGHVPAEKAQEAFSSGARLATPEEIHKADIHAEYDNFAGYLKSGAAEAANQALLGAGDALAVHAAKTFGSEAAAKNVAQTLSDLREENPIATGVGGVVGVVAPAIATGGESTLAKLLSAPTRALGAVGDIAEHGAAALAPELGESLAGRVAGGAMLAGARGAAEGALINAGNELTEESLGDPELSGEKLLAALGHGALLGGAAGGLLAGTGEIGRDILGRARPALQEAAGEQAFRALNPERRFVKLAEKIDGGAAGVGRELMDQGLIEAGDKITDIAPKVAAARGKAGEAIGQILDEADMAGVEGPRLSDIESKVRRGALADLKKLGLTNKGAIRVVDDFLADIRGFAEKHTAYEEPEELYKLGLAPSEEAAPRATKAIEIAGRKEPFLVDPNAGLSDEGGAGWRIGKDGVPILNEEPARSPIVIDRTRPGHIGDGPMIDPRMTEGADRGPGGVGIRKAYDVGLKEGSFTEEASSIRKPIKIGVDEAATNSARIKSRAEYDKNLTLTFKQAQELRASLDDKIKWSTNPLAPVNETTEALKAVRHAIEDTLVDAGDQAEGKLGRTWAQGYREAKLRYRRLAVADQAAENATAALVANRVVSPSDYLAGIAGFAGGGVHGGLAGLAMGAVHHVIRERGNSAAAVLLDKASVLAAVKNAARVVDAEVDRGIAGVLEPGKRAPVTERRGAFHKSANPYRDHHEAVTGATLAPDAHADDIEAAVAPLAGHAPNIAKSFQRAALRTTAALASAIPKGQMPPPSIMPQFDKPTVSDAEKEKYERLRAISHDPVGVTFTRAAKGLLTKSDVDAFRTNSPKLYDAVVQRTQEQLAHLKKPLDSGRESQLRILMGLPPADPKLAGILQQTYVTPAGHGQAKPNQGPGTGPKATNKQREGLANRVRLSGLNSDEGD